MFRWVLKKMKRFPVEETVSLLLYQRWMRGPGRDQASWFKLDSDRQGNREGSYPPLPGFQPDRSAVGCHQLAGNGQSQTAAAAGPAAAFIPFPEAVKNKWQVPGFYALPGILNSDQQGRFIPGCTQGDLSPLRCVAQGVIHQVAKYLVQALPITLYLQIIPVSGFSRTSVIPLSSALPLKLVFTSSSSSRIDRV